MENEKLEEQVNEIKVNLYKELHHNKYDIVLFDNYAGKLKFREKKGSFGVYTTFENLANCFYHALYDHILKKDPKCNVKVNVVSIPNQKPKFPRGEFCEAFSDDDVNKLQESINEYIDEYNSKQPVSKIKVNFYKSMSRDKSMNTGKLDELFDWEGYIIGFAFDDQEINSDCDRRYGLHYSMHQIAMSLYDILWDKKIKFNENVEINVQSQPSKQENDKNYYEACSADEINRLNEEVAKYLTTCLY